MEYEMPVSPWGQNCNGNDGLGGIGGGLLLGALLGNGGFGRGIGGGFGGNGGFNNCDCNHLGFDQLSQKIQTNNINDNTNSRFNDVNDNINRAELHNAIGRNQQDICDAKMHVSQAVCDTRADVLREVAQGRYEHANAIGDAKWAIGKDVCDAKTHLASDICDAKTHIASEICNTNGLIKDGIFQSVVNTKDIISSQKDCCCATDKLIMEEAHITRALINELDKQNLRDKYADCKDDNIVLKGKLDNCRQTEELQELRNYVKDSITNVNFGTQQVLNAVQSLVAAGNSK